MTWQELGKEILRLAPTAAGIATPFLGPAGPLLPVAAKALASAFGVESEDPQPDQLLEAIKADPDFLGKVHLAQVAFQTEQMRLEFGDIADARNRQIQHEKATGKTDINLYILAWIVVAGFFSVTGYLIHLSEAAKGLQDRTGAIFMLLGSLSTAFGMVMTFFFGAARSNQQRESTLLNAIPEWVGSKLGIKK